MRAEREWENDSEVRTEKLMCPFYILTFFKPVFSVAYFGTWLLDIFQLIFAKLKVDSKPDVQK